MPEESDLAGVDALNTGHPLLGTSPRTLRSTHSSESPPRGSSRLACICCMDFLYSLSSSSKLERNSGPFGPKQ